jgi:3-(3-hydroxy-phenyl)propionate hydroxylase
VLRGELDERWLGTYEAERRPNAAFYTELSVQLGRVIKQELTTSCCSARTPTPPPC